MDKIDRTILKLLNENARISFKNISEEIGLTSPAVKSRIEKMENDGIIKGYTTVINPEQAGYMISTFISVALEPSLKDEFFTFVDECPNIVECHGITGDYFVLMKVLFHSTMDLDNFLNKVHKYGETSTNIVLSTHKEQHTWMPEK